MTFLFFMKMLDDALKKECNHSIFRLDTHVP